MSQNQTAYTHPEVPEQYSIFGTLIWTLVLILAVPMLVGTVIVLLMVSIGYDVDDAMSFISKNDITLILTFVATLISYPMFKAACNHSDSRGLPLNFLALHPFKLSALLKVIAAVGLLLVMEYSVSYLLAIPTPDFMLELKSSVQTNKELVIVIINICILAPIIEEFIFRGMAYRRLEESQLGSKGAIVITSVLFTLVHFQYSWFVLQLLFPGSVLLGLIRYKTANLYYCILAHMLMNITSIVTLFTLAET